MIKSSAVKPMSCLDSMYSYKTPIITAKTGEMRSLNIVCLKTIVMKFFLIKNTMDNYSF